MAREWGSRHWDRDCGAGAGITALGWDCGAERAIPVPGCGSCTGMRFPALRWVPLGPHRLVKALRKSPARQEPAVAGCPLAEHMRAQSVPS